MGGHPGAVQPTESAKDSGHYLHLDQPAGLITYGLRSSSSPDWLKMKNSDAPATKREAEDE
jgi:hypothetical protein